jgi:Spy/CpxP family protein refolding chaperone
MRTRFLSLAFVGLVMFSGYGLADATLKGTLGLNIEQARQVDQIQAQHRPKFAAKRQERNTELRKLRRARIANDSKEIARQEGITAKLHDELEQIRMSEDEAIRRVLTTEQRKKFEEYLKLRKEMVGSSRDDKDF